MPSDRCGTNNRAAADSRAWGNRKSATTTAKKDPASSEAPTRSKSVHVITSPLATRRTVNERTGLPTVARPVIQKLAVASAPSAAGTLTSLWCATPSATSTNAKDATTSASTFEATWGSPCANICGAARETTSPIAAAPNTCARMRRTVPLQGWCPTTDAMMDMRGSSELPTAARPTRAPAHGRVQAPRSRSVLRPSSPRPAERGRPPTRRRPPPGARFQGAPPPPREGSGVASSGPPCPGGAEDLSRDALCHLAAGRARDTEEQDGLVGAHSAQALDSVVEGAAHTGGATSLGKKRFCAQRATFTRPMRTGTSTSGPMTAANAAPLWMPKLAMATAIASSKLLDAAVNESVADCL